MSVPRTVGHLRVRLFENRDTEQVRALVIRGLCDGDGSSLQVGLRAILWEPVCAVSYAIGGLGLALLFKSGGEPATVATGLLLCVIPAFWVKLWRDRLRKLWTEYIREFLEEGDMKNIALFYAEKKAGDDGDDDGRVSAFWVVEDTEGEKPKIVACIGLDSRGQADKSCSELRRLSVSEDYRRRGIALLLINTACSYARDRGVQTIRLSTTNYSAAAIAMYRRMGWVEVSKFRLDGPWIRNLWLYTLDLKL